MERQLCRAGRHQRARVAPCGPHGPVGFLESLLNLDPQRICLAWASSPVSAIAVAQRQAQRDGAGQQPAVRYAPDDPEFAQAGQ